jgi:diaminohydroxyphosphoribosylaminopyrimidine deaminase/5-amino-6-(5-phosphoribosylamino)uracil reductase
MNQPDPDPEYNDAAESDDQHRNDAHRIDKYWMDRALGLAGKGVGRAAPNPTVGCMLVDAEGNAVGEGFHLYDQRDHAEIVALRNAGGDAKGATAYVTLEPCSHFGRTAPCADALIAAGVKRVVVATLDVNPVVRGNGVARMRNAGIEVEVGLRKVQARRLNDAFAKYIRTGIPWVTLKAAMSLDGRIAPPPEQRSEAAPFWLTGVEARAEVHMLRHAHDAIVTGINTVLADDPMLNDRSGLPRRLPLLRVILDSQLRLPTTSKLVTSVDTTAGGDVLILTASRDADRARALRDRGVRVEQMESDESGISLERVLARLGELKISSVMIESGTYLNTAAIAGNFVDRLALFYAPCLLGKDAMPMVEFPAKIRAGLDVEVQRFGEDFCMRRTLKTYWD